MNRTNDTSVVSGSDNGPEARARWNPYLVGLGILNRQQRRWLWPAAQANSRVKRPAPPQIRIPILGA